MVQINVSLDANLSDFSIKTLEDRYLLPTEKSPQEGFARPAKRYSDSPEMAQRVYDYVSKGWMMYASPVLSNGDTDRGLPISCFLNSVDDSIQGITEHHTENAWLTVAGGGIGGYWGKVRSKGAKVRSTGSTPGMIPFLGVVDRQMLAFSQAENRRGSYAAYLDISHPEIVEFLEMRKPTGGDANRKCLNLHHAVVIPDSFMQLIQKKADNPDIADEEIMWDLVDPHTQEVTESVVATMLWNRILQLRVETGEPYIMFSDTVNRAVPEVHKALGLKVHQSNLCVAPETLVLTKEGWAEIKSIVNKQVDVWNGKEWSSTAIRKTSDAASLITIKFSDGAELTCTKQHKFYIQNSYGEKAEVKEANQLIIGDKLEKWDLPTISDTNPVEYRIEAYSQGFYSGDGNTGYDKSWVYSPKYDCIKDLIGEVSAKQTYNRRCWKHGPMLPKDHVPNMDSVNYKLHWLAGLLDSDGTIVKSIRGDCYQIGSIDFEFLKHIKLMLCTLGVHSKINVGSSPGNFLMPDGKGGQKGYDCQQSYRLLIGTAGTKQLQKLGLKCNRLVIRENQDANRSALHFIKVVEIIDSGRIDETYCFTEPKRNRGMFNGIVTGQCSEILLPTNSERTAVCCLSSVNLETYDEWKDDPQFIYDMVRFLDNVLQDFIDNAPDSMTKARYSAEQERSIGLGAMGLHSYFQKHLIPFDSDKARVINTEMFKNIWEKAEGASYELGIEKGVAPDYDKVVDNTPRRNVYLMAIAPNASSSILAGVSPGIEPIVANVYNHKTLSGTFVVKNKYLDKLLAKLPKSTYDEVWKSIFKNKGSVQHLKGKDILSDEAIEAFKTAKEINQKYIINMAADRQKFIDQSQSVNLFFSLPINGKEFSKLHLRAWKMGMKTLYYVRSEEASRAEILDNVERIKLDDDIPVRNTSVECVGCD